MQAEMLDSIVSSHSQELPNASSALKLFENPLFKVRVIMRLGDPWFVATDACKCLELKDDAGTICRELDEQDKVTLSREEFMGGVSNRGIICSVDSRDLTSCLYGAPERTQRTRVPDALKEKGVALLSRLFP